MSRILKSAILATLVAGVALGSVFAADDTITVEQLHQNKAQLGGKQVVLQGKVVKVNLRIMGRNFIHIEDGTGKDGNNSVTVTSKDPAAVGDNVVVKGKVVLDRDFGSGYSYPLLVEEATITPK